MANNFSDLHRVNGFDASVTMLQSMRSVRGGRWMDGAPSHLASELLMELADRGYFLGVPSAGEPVKEARDGE